MHTAFGVDGTRLIDRGPLGALLDGGLVHLVVELATDHPHARSAALCALLGICRVMVEDARGPHEPCVAQLRACGPPLIHKIDASYPALFGHQALLDGNVGAALAVLLLYLTRPPFAAQVFAISDTAVRMIVAYHMAANDDLAIATGGYLMRLERNEPGRVWAALPAHERFEGDCATRRLVVDFAVTGVRAAMSGRLETGSTLRYHERLLALLVYVIPLGQPEVAADMATRNVGRLLGELVNEVATVHARRGGADAEPCRSLKMTIMAMAGLSFLQLAYSLLR